MSTQIPLIEEKEQAGFSAVPQVGRKIPKKDDEISLLDLLIVMGNQEIMILWLTAVSAALGLVVSLLLPVRYTAIVVVLPPQQGTSMGAALASQLGNLGGMAALAGSSLGVKNPNEMFVAMFKTRTVEDAVIEHFSLMRSEERRVG